MTPYGDPFRVRPEAGLLVLFPSWLYHWVHPYSGRTPRIAISFNVTVAPAAGPTDAIQPAQEETRNVARAVALAVGDLRAGKLTVPDRALRRPRPK